MCKLGRVGYSHTHTHTITGPRKRVKQKDHVVYYHQAPPLVHHLMTYQTTLSLRVELPTNQFAFLFKMTQRNRKKQMTLTTIQMRRRIQMKKEMNLMKAMRKRTLDQNQEGQYHLVLHLACLPDCYKHHR